MRLLSLVAGLGALSTLAACAHPNDAKAPTEEERDVVAVADRNEPAVEISESAPPPSFAAPESGARPRLSHVVTLGQGTADAQYYGPDAPRAQPAQSSGPTVIVNNNVSGGGYGYGYYGYGYGGGYGGSRGSRSGGSAPRTESGYSGPPPTGWEGAGRTAAPGQTPGVGGNWPAAPSYGPRQAK